ncbi:MAG: tRNA (adenosine(37)-N6)-threonylcarbamoyltransferase complex ATPase subunit type 1 TsaE [Arenicella sp.]|nr:tRNA (adenosine(37)-N6)-threonylcarbamoyltransferase complex ATPase subunit type 1 TsaE [Arenicella sp.]
MVKLETQARPSSFSARSIEQTHDIGRQIARQLVFPSCIYLHGDMGAGKTTLTKSIIQAFGYAGAVTSPTYNLVQEYPVDQGVIYHMDLYRLEDPSEIEFLAVDDMWSERSLFLIEWPERAAGHLQAADCEIFINKAFDTSQDTRDITLNFLS